MKFTESRNIKLRCLNLSNYYHLMEVFQNDELVKEIIKTRREKEGFDTVGELAEIEGVDGDLMIKAARNLKVEHTNVTYKLLKLPIEPEKVSLVYNDLKVYVIPADKIPDLSKDLTNEEVHAEAIIHYHKDLEEQDDYLL